MPFFFLVSCQLQEQNTPIFFKICLFPISNEIFSTIGFNFPISPDDTIHSISFFYSQNLSRTFIMVRISMSLMKTSTHDIKFIEEAARLELAHRFYTITSSFQDYCLTN